MNFTRLFSKCWLSLSFFLSLFLEVPISFAGRLSGSRFLDYGHTGDSMVSFVHSCDTREGMSGECRPIQRCWAAEYIHFELESCEMRTRNQELFCCPDRTDTNIKVVSDRLFPKQPPTPSVKPTSLNPYTSKPTSKRTTRRRFTYPTTPSIRRSTTGNTGLSIYNRTRSVATRSTSTMSPWTRSTLKRSTSRRASTRNTFKSTATRRAVTRSTAMMSTVTRRLSTRSTSQWSTVERDTPTRSTTTRSALVQPGCGQWLTRRNKRDILLGEGEGDDMSFVIGGVYAADDSWPWMVSIYLSRNGAKRRFLCGGSLITKRHVLTAAHCFDNGNQSITYSVNLGSVKLTSSSENEQSSTFKRVAHVMIHEKYIPKVYYYDIAVATLSGNVIFTAKVSPICLPLSHELPMVIAHANVTVTGWGHTSFGGFPSNRLKQARMQIIPLKRCQESYNKLQTDALHEGITRIMMCAGSPIGGKDACQGDSGGPLVMQTGRRWIQVGIVSFGFRCGFRDFPGVYTRVSSYVKWIGRVLSEEE